MKKQLLNIGSADINNQKNNYVSEKDMKLKSYKTKLRTENEYQKQVIIQNILIMFSRK